MVKNFTPGEVTFYVFCSDKDMDGSLLNVGRHGWQQYNYNTKVYYATPDECQQNILQKLLDQVQPDVVFINGIFSRYFSIAPLLAITSAKKILSVRGMLHPGALSQKSMKKKIFLAIFRLRSWHHLAEFHATTEEEAQFIRDQFGDKRKIWVVPNFPKLSGYQNPLEKEVGKLRLVSIALISPMKNIKLVIEALAQCKSHAVYDIYGPVKDEAYWEECKVLMTGLPSNVEINYKGALEPEKVKETLSHYHVMVQPSKSENFGHSIFEALSAGMPVITSRFTPWNDLQKNKAGYNVSIDNTVDLVKSIEELTDLDHYTYEHWTKQAYAYALDKVDIPSIKKGYENMFGIAEAVPAQTIK
ncbi:MAG: glycosyltransferase family 4 protein, partial [Flavipsychrobacter sp.]